MSGEEPSMTDMSDLAEQLARISEELADMAIQRLSEASSSAGVGRPPDPDRLAEERRISRARRAVERAVALLGSGDGD